MDEFTPVTELMIPSTDTHWEIDGKAQYSLSRVVNYDIEKGIEFIISNFIIEDKESVSTYLIENTDLVEVLQDGYVKLRDILPNNKLILSHYSDYELDWQYLYITVLSDETFEKRIEIERKIIGNWMMKLPREIKQLVNIVVING